MTKIPAVSVIIPMFNAAKYVGQCLESILAQTFQDFEVIVVDDCSTDSSREIVENFAPKFGGRLMLLQLDRNTGSGAVPRNTGLKFARGEYIFFADADDLLTLTALEELYTLAKNFDAEVVYCEKYYKASADLSEIVFDSEQKGDFITRPTLEPDNLTTRVQEILKRKFWVMPWGKLVKRTLLVDNEIFFLPVKIAEDDIWTYELVFFAKKFLRVPNVVYVYRQADRSVLRKEKSPQETINFWLSPIVLGLKHFDDMLSKVEFLRLNPQYRCAVLEQLMHSKTRQLFDASLKLKPHEIYATIKDEFGEHLGERDVLISWLLADMIAQQQIVVANRQRIKALERKLEENFS